MNVILPLQKIHAAAPARQPGYLAECLRLGKVTGNGQAQLIEFTPAQFADIRKRFAKPGLGDRIHRIAGPIGRAINWPCLKGDGTTDLKPGSPCDKLRQKLNKLTQ
jgi:hypothetical protein